MIARELAIQGPVDKWEEAEMLVREEVKKNGKTGAAKSEADKKIERSRLEAKLEAKKKAKGSKASKWNGKKREETNRENWWGKTWSQSWHDPEHLPGSDCFFAPGAWMPFGEYFSATCRRGQYPREARELAISGHAKKGFE